MGRDKEGSSQWQRRGQFNWDGERIVIIAQDQGHHTNGLKKMEGLSQSEKCRFHKVETDRTIHLLFGCIKTRVRTAVHTEVQQSLWSNPPAHRHQLQHPSPRKLIETRTKSDKSEDDNGSRAVLTK